MNKYYITSDKNGKPSNGGKLFQNKPEDSHVAHLVLGTKAFLPINIDSISDIKTGDNNNRTVTSATVSLVVTYKSITTNSNIMLATTPLAIEEGISLYKLASVINKEYGNILEVSANKEGELHVVQSFVNNLVSVVVEE